MTNVSRTERQPLDPALRRYLDSIASAPAPGAVASDEERALRGRALMRQALQSRSQIQGLPNAVRTLDVAIAAGLGGRLYTPSADSAPAPVLVYAHGGGWVVGSIDTHDPFCRLLSEAAGVIILSVEYRLAPEHPFPAALDDVVSAYRWAATNAEGFAADPRQVWLGGDSAGANLAAVAANLLVGEVGPGAVQALLLLYPVTDHPSAGHASYSENAAGYGLDAQLMRWFWQQYARDVSPDDPKISPLRTKRIPPLPPTLVATAEYDPLRDEGAAYAQKLVHAGVPVTHLHAPDMHHNFAVHPGTVARFPQSIAALRQFAVWLASRAVAAGGAGRERVAAS